MNFAGTPPTIVIGSTGILLLSSCGRKGTHFSRHNVSAGLFFNMNFTILLPEWAEMTKKGSTNLQQKRDYPRFAYGFARVILL